MAEEERGPAAEAPGRKTFCEACLADASGETPGNVSTSNGIGRKFYGGAEECPTCGSKVRTLWWVLIDFPLVPRGSYRYIKLEEGFEGISQTETFLARQTRTRWDQVLRTWAVGIAIAVAVFAAIHLYERWKRGR